VIGERPECVEWSSWWAECNCGISHHDHSIPAQTSRDFCQVSPSTKYRQSASQATN